MCCTEKDNFYYKLYIWLLFGTKNITFDKCIIINDFSSCGFYIEYLIGAFNINIKVYLQPILKAMEYIRWSRLLLHISNIEYSPQRKTLEKKLPKIKYIRYVSRNLFVLTLNSTNNTYGKKQTKTQYIRINIWCIIVEVESFFFLSRIAMQKFISTFPATDNEFQCFILRVQLI